MYVTNGMLYHWTEYPSSSTLPYAWVESDAHRAHRGCIVSSSQHICSHRSKKGVKEAGKRLPRRFLRLSRGKTTWAIQPASNTRHLSDRPRPIPHKLALSGTEKGQHRPAGIRSESAAGYVFLAWNTFSSPLCLAQNIDESLEGTRTPNRPNLDRLAEGTPEIGTVGRHHPGPRPTT